MNFILTTEIEKDLKDILDPFYYKFLDVEVLRKDYENNHDLGDPEYTDFHFNCFLTKKIQNSFKSSKSKYFVYKVPVIHTSLVENLQRFIEEKYSEKIEKFMIVSTEIKECKKELKELDNLEFIKYCPELKSFE